MEYKMLLRALKEELGISYRKMSDMIGMNDSTFRGVMNDEQREFSDAQKESIKLLVSRIRAILDSLEM